MSKLREDISALFDTEVTDNKQVTSDGKPYKQEFIIALINSWCKGTNNMDDLLKERNLSFKSVEEDEHDSGCDYVYLFTRADDKSVFEYVKVSSNSYTADEWKFVTPKEVLKTIYV